MNLSYYHRPTSLDQAFDLMQQSPRAQYVAGGTDLMVRLCAAGGAARPEALVSLRRIAELRGISDQGPLRLGAGTRLAELVNNAVISRTFPELLAAARAIGSPQIRSVATVGGNLANASPCADLAPPLLAAGARVEIRGPGGERVLPLEDLFVGPRQTCLTRGEVLMAVLVDPPATTSRAVYLRRSRVRMDLAQVSVAVRLDRREGRCHAVRIAAGAVAPTPVRLPRAEALLVGREIDEEIIAAAAEQAREEIAPISDLRASADYRRQLTGVLVRRALAQLAGEEQG